MSTQAVDESSHSSINGGVWIVSVPPMPGRERGPCTMHGHPSTRPLANYNCMNSGFSVPVNIAQLHYTQMVIFQSTVFNCSCRISNRLLHLVKPSIEAD